MIPIPEELAKRVLEALEQGANIVDRTGYYSTADTIYAVRDELAALLTPKEAT
jgi:hypothetical protein